MFGDSALLKIYYSLVDIKIKVRAKNWRFILRFFRHLKNVHVLNLIFRFFPRVKMRTARQNTFLMD